MTRWEHFPARTLRNGTPLYRIHRHDRSAAYFSQSGAHRFDPPGTSRVRYGVCYLGLEPLTAYVEVFGRIGTIRDRDVTSKRLPTARANADIRLADLTDRSVLGRFSVTAAHSTAPDYGASQALSETLHKARFHGIVYRVRHDPSMELEAVALFDKPFAGREPIAITWSTPRHVPESLTADGLAFGIRLMPEIELP